VRFLVLSDLHANWHALDAVLSDAEGQYERIVCCGDLVGYNAQPGRVLEWTRQNCVAVIRGNHDKVVAGLEDLEWFNEVAQVAARWTIEQLSEEQLLFLRELPKGPYSLPDFTMYHGSPRDEDEYLITGREAAASFDSIQLPLNFFGHTHLEGGFFQMRGRLGAIPQLKKNESETVLELHPDIAYLINPGSVGQPRDGDPRASYAIFDSEKRTVSLRRVSYPIDATAEEIYAAGLPDVLAFRLYQGL
jgi:predicted phosphodiesterase